MTVAELIAELQKMPQDALVIVMADANWGEINYPHKAAERPRLVDAVKGYALECSWPQDDYDILTEGESVSIPTVKAVVIE